MVVPSEKVINIQHTNQEDVQITIPADKAKELTCHWLLQQAIAKLKQKFPQEKNFDDIVTLCTVTRDYAVDHYLTFHYRNLSVLKNGITLKPFYRQKVEETKDPFDEEARKVTLDDFIVEIKLGYGAFSKVFLLRKKDTGELFALKQIPKADMSDKKKKMILNERQAMLDLSSSSHVVSLKYSFQTENYCYFVMDFVPCGDMHHVIARRKLTESEARYYVAETILALNAIHKEGYIYRDLKPENILLDLDGHIKISDFGLAKKKKNYLDQNFSYCGTPEIIAPEIHRGDGYNFMVDFYNLGTLTYELVTRRVPVLSEHERVFVEENNPALKELSDDLKDFLRRLLKTKPSSRLGANKGWNQVCAHPWMSSINMSQLNERNIKAPILFDPNSVHFKTKTPITEDIDKLEWGAKPLNTIKDNTLINFSFYGFGGVFSTDKLTLMHEKSYGKESQRDSFDNQTTKESTCSQTPHVYNKSATKSKFVAEEENFQMLTEIDEENESVQTKVVNYKPNIKESMKVMQNFTPWGKSKKENVEKI